MTVAQLLLTTGLLIFVLWLVSRLPSPTTIALRRVTKDIDAFAVVLGTQLLPAVLAATKAMDAFSAAFYAPDDD